MSCVLGVVQKTVVEVCVHCGKPHSVVIVRGRNGAGWSQHQPHNCVTTTVRGPGPTALADLFDDEEAPLGIG